MTLPFGRNSKSPTQLLLPNSETSLSYSNSTPPLLSPQFDKTLVILVHQIPSSSQTGLHLIVNTSKFISPTIVTSPHKLLMPPPKHTHPMQLRESTMQKHYANVDFMIS